MFCDTCDVKLQHLEFECLYELRNRCINYSLKKIPQHRIIVCDKNCTPVCQIQIVLKKDFFPNSSTFKKRLRLMKKGNSNPIIFYNSLYMIDWLMEKVDQVRSGALSGSIAVLYDEDEKCEKYANLGKNQKKFRKNLDN